MSGWVMDSVSLYMALAEKKEPVNTAGERSDKYPEKLFCVNFHQQLPPTSHLTGWFCADLHVNS